MELSKLPSRPRWSWLVAFVGMLGSAGGFWLMRLEEDRAIQARFERYAVEQALEIEHRLTDDVLALESTAALFMASENVTLEEFRIATGPLLARHPSLRAVGWNRLVSGAEREAHETALREAGFADYQITERSDSGELVPAPDRPAYTVVEYIEPLAGNRAALGFNVGSERRRREAFERATATGKLAFTSQLSLVQEEGSPGFLAVWPVYHRHEPAEWTAAHERHLAGFAVGVFHVADVVEGAVRASGRSGITVCLEDVTDPEAIGQLYATPTAEGETPKRARGSGFSHSAIIEPGGRRWRMEFWPDAAAIAQQRGVLPWLVAVTGLVVTALMTAYLQTVLIANEDLEREIGRRRRAERERRRLDAKLRESQKLESLGVLAGGIAHDFNNLLTGMLGNADLVLQLLPPQSAGRSELGQVRLAAIRAADLTRQMLAYSGTRPFATEVVDLSKIVDEMAHLLEASVSKRAELRWELAEDPATIEGDPTQLRQIVMNLLTNASDALGQTPGRIALCTGVRVFERESLAAAYLDQTAGPGPYVFFEVSDSGCGMEPDELARAFDPFFTTKFQGRGLGLAAVLGIVRSHHGAVWVDSKVGIGTTFTVAFPPAQRAEPSAETTERKTATSYSGSGTVLVVDDEPAVRLLAARLLERIGFEVRTATDGREGVDLFRRHAHEVRAVLLDATMPKMGGGEALRAMRAIRSDIIVVLSSGYAEEELLDELGAERPDGFLAKPYTAAALNDVLRPLLG